MVSSLNKPSGRAIPARWNKVTFKWTALNGGPPLAYYPGGVPFRGVEEDAFVLTIAGNTIMVAGSTSGLEIDQIRILTASKLGPPVPEPATAMTWVIIAIYLRWNLCSTTSIGLLDLFLLEYLAHDFLR